MGAEAALMVSDEEPGLISSAVLFEPITPPPAPGLDPESIPLVIGATPARDVPRSPDGDRELRI